MIQYRNHSEPKIRRLFIASLLTIICIFSVNSCMPTMASLEKRLAHEKRPLTKPASKAIIGIWEKYDTNGGGLGHKLEYHENNLLSMVLAGGEKGVWSPKDDNNIPSGHILVKTPANPQNAQLLKGSTRWSYLGQGNQGSLVWQLTLFDANQNHSVKFINDHKMIFQASGNLFIFIKTNEITKAPNIPKAAKASAKKKSWGFSKEAEARIKAYAMWLYWNRSGPRPPVNDVELQYAEARYAGGYYQR